MYKILDSLYNQSLEGKNFNNICKLIFDKRNMYLAFRELKNNSGRNTHGVDKMTFKELVKEDSEQMWDRIVEYSENFKDMPSRSVKIPKSNGNLRPIGIANIRDKLIQQMVYNILEPIAEGKFIPVNYAFRREKTAKDAINNVVRKSVENHWIVEIDFESFFDNLDHKVIISSLKRIGIKDRKFLKLIYTILESPVDGVKKTVGVPQGSILGPLLANIVLHELDELIYYGYEDLRKLLGRVNHSERNLCSLRHDINRRDERWMGVRTGYVQTKNTITKTGVNRKIKKYQLRKVNVCRGFLTRYADDTVVSCRTRHDAQKAYWKIENFCNRKKIPINKEKSRIINGKKHRINFLGYSIKISENLKYTIKIKDSKWKDIRREVFKKSKEVFEGRISVHDYNMFVLGISNYFDYVTNYQQSMHYLDKIQFLVLRRYNGINGLRRVNPKIKANEKYYGVSGKYLNKIVFELQGKIILPFVNKEHSRDDLKYKSPNPKRVMYKLPDKIKESDLHQTMNTDWFKYESSCKRKNIFMNVFYGGLFIKQKGLDPISKETLYNHDTEVHHIIPTYKGGDDIFNNLMILNYDTHKLIHNSNYMSETRFKHMYNDGNYKKYKELKEKV